MMSWAAKANGGQIAPRSLVAVLQSAGAAGIGASATATIAAAGAAGGVVVNKVIDNVIQNKDDDKKDPDIDECNKLDGEIDQ
ncbi:interferon alpha-inducible protein 27-like protein 2A [Cherax quadricarinatus]